MSAVFTPEYRQQVLDLLLAHLEYDRHLAGAIIVGSGAQGFSDEHSDIDIVIVVATEADRAAAWQRSRPLLLGLLEPWDVTEIPSTYGLVLLLPGYLEVDLGFTLIDELAAQWPRWRVAFDRTHRLETIMQTSWQARPVFTPDQLLADRLDCVWHRIIRCVVALKRGQPWWAMRELDILRSRAIELCCLRAGLETDGLRAAGSLPAEVQQALARTLPADPGPASVARALRAAVTLFFEAAQELEGTDRGEAARLGKLMAGYLAAADPPYLD